MWYTLENFWIEVNPKGAYLKWLEEGRMRWRPSVVVREMVPRYYAWKVKDQKWESKQ